MNTTDELLTVGEVANRWDCSTDTVRRLANEGRLPAIRVGREGYRLFNRVDVERVGSERQKALQQRAAS